MVVGPWLLGLAARRPHVLLAVAPGATAARLAAEAALADTDATAVGSPADADVLLVVGEPGDEIAVAVERVWRQIPRPRARARLTDPAAAGSVLNEAFLTLRESARQAHDGERQGASSAPAADEHGGHGDMSMPAGLMMADRAADRDGLKLDVVQLTWGPVLADWPPGLVVTTTLQGDLVQSAEGRVLPARSAGPSFWHEGEPARRHAAAYLDSLGRLVAVAGWPAMAVRLRRLRDDVLADAPMPELRQRLAVVDRRMRRSWPLRWATDGLGVLGGDLLEQYGVSGPAAAAVRHGGDVTARWRCWLDTIGALLDGRMPAAAGGPRGYGSAGRPASAALLDAALPLMAGVDVAAARIVLASFDPDPDELVAAGPPPAVPA